MALMLSTNTDKRQVMSIAYSKAQPAELAVQLPTKFVMSINLKTAKGLGLDVPLLLQQRADEVID